MADYDLQYQDTHIDALLATANELKTAGYIYKGVATPSTNPGTPTDRVAYLASEPGTYTNFGGIVITSGLYSLTYASGTWTGTQMRAGSDIEVVQETGQSTSDVMSQKAVSDEIDIPYFALSFGSEINYTINSLGDWTNSASKHYLVKVDVGNIVKITANANYTCIYRWLTSNAAPVNNSAAPISSIDGVAHEIPVGESTYATAPSDAQYLFVLAVHNGNTRTPSSVEMMQPVLQSLFDKETYRTAPLTTYVILANSYPTLTLATNYYITNYIAVNEGDIIFIPRVNGTKSMIVVSGYSSQNQSAYVDTLRIRGKADVGTETYDYGFIIPAGVNYMRLSGNVNSPNTTLSYYLFSKTNGAIYAEIARQMDFEYKQNLKKIEHDASLPLNTIYPNIRPRKGCVMFQIDCATTFFAKSSQYANLLKTYGVDYSTYLCLSNTFSNYINYIKDLSLGGNEIGVHGLAIHTDYDVTLNNYLSAFISQGLKNLDGYVESQTLITDEELAIAKKYFAWIIKNGGDYQCLNNDYLNAVQDITEEPTKLKRLGIELHNTEATSSNFNTAVANIKNAIDKAVNERKILVIYGHSYAETTGTSYTIYNEVLEPILAYLKTYIDADKVIVGRTTPLLEYYYTRRVSE